MTPQETATIEDLLKKPCWVIDFLPYQVPKDSPGQFFAVEKYYTSETRMAQLRHRYLDILLKLNCYYDFRIFVGGDKPSLRNIPPDALEKTVLDTKHATFIMVEPVHALITIDGNDAYISVYSPPDDLLSLLKTLAAADGLFVWQPEQGKNV